MYPFQQKVNINTRIGPSFSLGNRVKRLVWQFIYLLLFRYSPRPFHTWRKFILTLFGAKIGSNTHIYSSVKIWAPWNIEIGNECGIGDHVQLYAMDKIRIGNRTVVSQESYLCCGTHDFNKQGFPLTTKPITIGSDVWIAARVFVHPGVEIGDGCVVGACSVITNNLKPWHIYTGNPFKEIKKRESL
jgi:putative colanic acid biosynthesis acetyltransferase WcaF